MDIQIVWQ